MDKDKKSFPFRLPHMKGKIITEPHQRKHTVPTLAFGHDLGKCQTSLIIKVAPDLGPGPSSHINIIK